MNNEPLVTIVIPTYKDRGGLKRAIESVLQQTYSNIEIIVVDDNNPDDEWRNCTDQLVTHISDSRLRYIRHSKNMNGATARNTGINNSVGEYIAFLDDDDYFLPTKIEKQVQFLLNSRQFDCVYCQGERDNKLIAGNLKEGDLSEDILMLKSKMFTPSLMFKRSALEALNGFDESFVRHQDYELLLRFFKLGFKIGAIQEVLFGIGRNEGENIPSAKRLEELKKYFFDKFSDDIEIIDKRESGFKRRVYATHYSSIFLAYIKEKDLKNSLRVINSFFWMAPKSFLAPIIYSAVIHLKPSMR